MKNLLIISILFFSFSSMKSQNIFVKTNVIGLISGSYGLTAEIPIMDKKSIEIGGSVIKTKDNTRGFSIAAQYKLFIKNPNRFYIAPSFEYASLVDNHRTHLTIFALGAVGGYQYLLLNENNKGFVIDLFFGPATINVNRDIDYDYEEHILDKFGLMYGVSIGFVL